MDEKEILKVVGGNIARIRKEKGLRQIDLADKCEMEDSNIIRIEKGRTNPTTLTLFKIAKALEVDIKQFFEKIELKNMEEIEGTKENPVVFEITKKENSHEEWCCDSKKIDAGFSEATFVTSYLGVQPIKISFKDTFGTLKDENLIKDSQNNFLLNKLAMHKIDVCIKSRELKVGEMITVEMTLI